MDEKKEKISHWFIIPVMIAVTLIIIGIIFILSGVFIESPIIESENWYNIENTKYSRIYLGVFVGAIGLLVIGLMTPVFVIIKDKKFKLKKNKKHQNEFNQKITQNKQEKEKEVTEKLQSEMFD